MERTERKRLPISEIGTGSAARENLRDEGSANLQSCRNIEQFSIANDKQLYDFHTAWMIDVIMQSRE